MLHICMPYLDGLFDPKVRADSLPILSTDGVKEAVVEPAADACIENLNEFLADVRLRAAHAGEESVLQL